MRLRKAVLIIHGFAGGTYDEEELANYLKLNTRYDVYQFTLPGHSGKIRHVKYQEWINSSENMLNTLIDHGYNKIYLIGHSMGGVIATYLAGKYKEVKKMVLAAPAFQYLQVENEKLNVKDSIKATPKIFKTYGTNILIERFLKAGVSSAKEFVSLVKQYYNTPKTVTCPTLILQGKNDNIVPLSSSEYVYNNLSSRVKKIEYLENVTHDVFRKNKKKEIFELVKTFLEAIEGGF